MLTTRLRRDNRVVCHGAVVWRNRRTNASSSYASTRHAIRLAASWPGDACCLPPPWRYGCAPPDRCASNRQMIAAEFQSGVLSNAPALMAFDQVGGLDSCGSAAAWSAIGGDRLERVASASSVVRPPSLETHHIRRDISTSSRLNQRALSFRRRTCCRGEIFLRNSSFRPARKTAWSRESAPVRPSVRKIRGIFTATDPTRVDESVNFSGFSPSSSRSQFLIFGSEIQTWDQRARARARARTRAANTDFFRHVIIQQRWRASSVATRYKLTSSQAQLRQNPIARSVTTVTAEYDQTEIS